MIPVVNVEGMRGIDKEAIHGDVDTGFSYMRKAGDALFEAIRTHQLSPERGDIAIVCGKGNNGGDGFVAARLLLDAGFGVMCFALCECDDLHGEARMAFDMYAEANGNFLVLHDVADCEGFVSYSLLVDAILGTGIKGSPRGLAAELIQEMNESGKPIIAVDTPSGLNNDTGATGEPCIRATTTVTMGFPKIGAYFHPGRNCAGEIQVAALGYPQDIVENHEYAIFVHKTEDFRGMLPPRKPQGSKFEHGLAMVVGGSRGMTGSTVLACEAALRTGCGMVHCVTPGSAISSLSAHLVETVLHPVEETPGGTASSKALGSILELSGRMQSACIGPGFSHAPSTSQLVRELVHTIDYPFVLDADGVNAFKGRAEDLKHRQTECVITPHRGEWKRLFGELTYHPEEALKILRKKAQEYEFTILLKGNPTLIAGSDGTVYIMPYGDSGLASAGSGDVLSGIIVSLLAQGCGVNEAARLGAYIHGMAGESASRKLTPYSCIASDIIGSLPEVFQALTQAPITKDESFQ